MKKTIFILSAILVVSFSFAQMPDKFVKAMEAKIALIDSTHTVEGYTDLANAFERIADAEKNQWLAYYYAAFCHVMVGFNSIGKQIKESLDKIETEANIAEMLILKAEDLSKDNSEIFCIKNMVTDLQIMANPSVNGFKYGQQAVEYLETAKKLNPENPRVYLLEGQSAMYKPVEWGGGQEKAKEFLQEAEIKYGVFKPETSIHPNWGKDEVQLLLKRIKN